MNMINLKLKDITYPSKDFKKWFKTIHPEKCKCGKKIKERKFGINGIDVCEQCFYEATKHVVFH